MNTSLLEKLLKVVQVICAIVEYALRLFIPETSDE